MLEVLSPHNAHADVLLREAELRRKADAQRKRKEDAEMEKGLTIQDLTKGLLNYKFTGLSFSKGCEDGSMKYVPFV